MIQDYFSSFTENNFFNNFISRIDLKIWEIGYCRRPDRWRGYSPKGDPYFRLYFVTDGKGAVRSGEELFELRKGHLCLIPPQLELRYETEHGKPSHYWVHFYSDALRQVMPLRMLSLPCEEENVWEKMLKNIRLGDASSTYENNLECRRMIGRFLCSPAIEGQIGTGNIPDDFLLAAEYIHRHYMQPITTKTLAGLVRMNKNDFSRKFREYFKEGPKQYLCRTRIEHAKILLLRTSLSTKEIAAATGYGDEFFFYRIFKKYANMTPSAYRYSSEYPGKIPQKKKSANDHFLCSE